MATRRASLPVLPNLLAEIRACTLCAPSLPLGPRPVLRATTTARILIIGQAPGTKVHASGIPWDDASGKRLRSWLEMEADAFYDDGTVAIVPMGFCYPGKGPSGDLPPRPECAPTWHPRLMPLLSEVRLTIVIGGYATAWVLGQRAKNLLGGPQEIELSPTAETGKTPSVTDAVRAWTEGKYEGEAAKPWGAIAVLPHPSPRNQRWLKTNPWFEAVGLPRLRAQVRAALP